MNLIVITQLTYKISDFSKDSDYENSRYRS